MQEAKEEPCLVQGEVVKLDRGFPLVRVESGAEYRCKHATALVKNERVRAVIGDKVELALPEGKVGDRCGGLQYICIRQCSGGAFQSVTQRSRLSETKGFCQII